MPPPKHSPGSQLLVAEEFPEMGVVAKYFKTFYTFLFCDLAQSPLEAM